MGNRRVTFHFVDGTKLTLEWPKQPPAGVFKFEAAVEKALESQQLAVETEGNLMIIQMKNVKFAEVIPAPEKLSEGIIRNAKRVE